MEYFFVFLKKLQKGRKVHEWEACQRGKYSKQEKELFCSTIYETIAIYPLYLVFKRKYLFSILNEIKTFFFSFKFSSFVCSTTISRYGHPISFCPFTRKCPCR